MRHTTLLFAAALSACTYHARTALTPGEYFGQYSPSAQKYNGGHIAIEDEDTWMRILVEANEPSLLVLTRQSAKIAYRVAVDLPKGWIVVRAVRENESSRLEIVERWFHPARQRSVSLALHDDEWRSVSGCWEGDGIPWDKWGTRIRNDLSPVDLLIEAARGGRYSALALHAYDFDAVRACAAWMLQKGGVPVAYLSSAPTPQLEP